MASSYSKKRGQHKNCQSGPTKSIKPVHDRLAYPLICQRLTETRISYCDKAKLIAGKKAACCAKNKWHHVHINYNAIKPYLRKLYTVYYA